MTRLWLLALPVFASVAAVGGLDRRSQIELSGRVLAANDSTPLEVASLEKRGHSRTDHTSYVLHPLPRSMWCITRSLAGPYSRSPTFRAYGATSSTKFSTLPLGIGLTFSRYSIHSPHMKPSISHRNKVTASRLRFGLDTARHCDFWRCPNNWCHAFSRFGSCGVLPSRDSPL